MTRIDVMDPSFICKLFFTLGTTVGLGGVFFPSFRKNIMNYGSRKDNSSSSFDSNRKVDLNYLFEVVALQVPHSWFTHYYIFSVTLSVFWAFQIYTQGPVLRFLAAYSSHSESAMSIQQFIIAWLFMAVQGARRLYESIVFAKPSQAKMWVGLWAA